MKYLTFNTALLTGYPQAAFLCLLDEGNVKRDENH